MQIDNQAQTNTNTQDRDAAIQIINGKGQVITSEIIDGTTYYTAVRRGVSYLTYQTTGGNWFVATKRLSLGRFNAGGGKYYDDLAALAAGCKAFADLPALLEVSTETAN